MAALERITVSFGGQTVVAGVSLEVRAGEVLCLVGPSGSGKTTLLRVLAGLVRPDDGRVMLDAVEVAGPGTFVEPEHRRIGMVFQDYALFPHLTVAENVAYGLRRRSHADAVAIVAASLEQVGLTRYAKSHPHELSGGERQRVALARALAPEPAVLLMDEPFSSLDAGLRERVRGETLALLRGLGTTTIIVTHDPVEAARSGDRIALVRGGRLLQCDTPRNLFARPVSAFAARFFGTVNELPGVCDRGAVETPLGTFRAPADVAHGTAVRVCVRPHQVCLGTTPRPVRARVAAVDFLGDVDQVQLVLDAAATPVVASVAGRATVVPGDTIFLHVDAAGVVIVPDET